MGEKGAILVSAIVLLNIASATPDIQFPVNSQVPPVAQVSRPYTFIFAESTFMSAAGPITYTVADQPAWLQLDSGTRTFSGMPDSNDVGSVTFQLIAADGQGPTPLSVTLVVVQDVVVETGRSVLSQLADFGVPSSPTSIMLYPLQSFALHFSADTFLRTSTTTAYYAISEDNSPLPPWLEFDVSTLGFSGTTPPLVSPTATPETYSVKLIASDVPGFSEASAAFQIVVGYHTLYFSVAILNINATSGTEGATSPLRGTLSLDGNLVRDADIVSVTADAPRWLVLDQANISLSGIPPADATNLSVTVSVMDVFGDFANATIDFSFNSNTTRLFLGGAPVANATIGQEFNYTISQSLLATDNVTVVAGLGSASAWMTFNSSNLSFNGNVPQDLAPASIGIALYATLGHETEEETFQINIIRGSATTSLTRTITSSASVTSLYSIVPPSSTSPVTATHSHLSKRTQLKIILAAILSTVTFILLIASFMCCWRRTQKVPTEPGPVAPDQIPASPVDERVEAEPPDAEVEESAYCEELQKNATPNEPPRIELSWAPDSLRKAKARLSRRTSARDDSILNLSFSGSLPEDLETSVHNSRNEIAASQHFVRRSRDLAPFVSTKTSNYSRKRTPLQPLQAKAEHGTAPKRASRAWSAVSTVTSGLPNRLSGAGHGSGGVNLTGRNDIRSSWQDTESSLPSTDSRATALDIVETFPRPPFDRVENRSMRSPQRIGKASLRMVATSSSPTDSPIDERQRWHIERARDPIQRNARFPHAWSSRPHSGARHLEADNSTFFHDDQLTPVNSPQPTWSQHAAVGASNQPEMTNARRSLGRPFIRPPSKVLPARSTASSGQFDSALSTSSSQWEDEVLTTEVDFQEGPNAAESSRTGGQAQSRRGTTAATGPSGVSSSGDLDRFPASRKLRLGDVPGQRPVSVGEGNLQSQRSHQGSLAFV